MGAAAGESRLTDLAGKVVWITGASGGIGEALALDASARGDCVMINVIRRVSETRPGVEIGVIDHGPGIPPEVLLRIFDPFFTTKPVGQGTGLGLSLALRIADDHGGRLVAESRPGEGTILRLWLPEAAT